jgi:hypothetical protein
MITIETISIVFTGLSISLAAFYYIGTLRNANRMRELTIESQENALETRQAQLFIQLFNRFNDADFFNKFDESVKRSEWREYEQERETIGLVAAFFEGIGVLVEQKLVNINLVSRLMSTNIMIFWESVEPVIREFRDRTHNPYAWEYVEWLYDNIKLSRLERQPAYTTN